MRLFDHRCRNGSDDQAEALFDLLDADAVARHERRVVRRMRALELAVYEDHPVAADDSLVADEPVHADRGGPAGDAHDA